jgi:hypothetical protein
VVGSQATMEGGRRQRRRGGEGDANGTEEQGTARLHQDAHFPFNGTSVWSTHGGVLFVYVSTRWSLFSTLL